MTKTNRLTSEMLVAMNLAACGALGGSFTVSRPHNIKLILKQYDQLADKEEIYRRAYVANMIVRLRPFASNNVRTAILVLLSVSNSTESTVKTLHGMFKHGSDTEHLVQAGST